MDLTRWLPLFEKCPELRPTRADGNHVLDINDVQDWGWYSHGEKCHGDILYEDEAATHIGYRAVWWLAARDGCPVRDREHREWAQH